MSFTSSSSEGTRSLSARAVNDQIVERLLSAPPAAQRAQGTVLRVLHTTGRRTGCGRTTPVGVLSYRGKSYLVCPDRTRDWPQNPLAEPNCLIMAGDDRDQCRATPVQGDEAVDCVEAYLSTVEVSWARKAFALADDADREQIAAALGRMAVFRLAASQRPDAS